MQVTPPPDVSRIAELWPFVKDLLTIVIVPYLAWNFKINKEMNDKLDKNNKDAIDSMGKMNLEVAKVNQTLVGQDGKNGLRSRFIRIERQVEGIMMAMSRAGMNIRVNDLTEEEK